MYGELLDSRPVFVAKVSKKLAADKVDGPSRERLALMPICTGESSVQGSDLVQVCADQVRV